MARRTLTREKVLRAAIALADADGLESLSMRRLAAAVGVQAMSLYNHVADKDDLLDGITELVAEQIEPADPAAGWRAAIRARTLSAREVLHRHPWAASLMESRGYSGETRMAHHEALLGTFRLAGFSLELTHRALLTLDSHLYGFMLQEQAWPTSDPEAIAVIVASMAESMPPERYPFLTELTARAVRVGPADAGAFAFGLDLILDGLERARDTETAGGTGTAGAAGAAGVGPVRPGRPVGPVRPGPTTVATHPGGRLPSVTATRSLQLPEARQEDLHAIRAFVAGAARSLGADDAIADDLVQAVDESATNVIRHGYRGMPGRLEVAVERDGPDLIVAIRDDAPPFDPTDFVVQDLDAPLSGRRPGGFGIHLTRTCVDRVTHTQRVPAGNELILIRHLEPPTEERTT